MADSVDVWPGLAEGGVVVARSEVFAGVVGTDCCGAELGWLVAAASVWDWACEVAAVVLLVEDWDRLAAGSVVVLVAVVLLLTPSLMGEVGESKSLDSFVRFFFRKPSDGMNQAPLRIGRLALRNTRVVVRRWLLGRGRAACCGGTVPVELALRRRAGWIEEPWRAAR